MRIIFGLIFMSFALNSQPWMEGLSKPEKENFFAIQESFYEYIDGVDKSKKGTGYKQFKRWEWFWETRVLEDGSFPDRTNFKSVNINQKKSNPTRLNSVSEWKTIGPDTSPGGYVGLGRINVVRAEPDNNNHLWAGAASGGLWYSSNTGQTWECKSENESVFEVLGVSDIAFDPNDTDIIYIASGDRDSQDTYSSGLLKSTDGGDTWENTDLNYDVEQTRVRLNKILINPNDTDNILVGGSNGIWKTTNAGDTWNRVRSGFHALDMEMHPTNPDIIYASEFSPDILKSTDFGENWTELAHNNLPDSDVQRVAIAVTKDDPNYLVALMSAPHSGLKGVYRSNDAGVSWIQIAGSLPNMLHWSQNSIETGGQGWYDLCIEINPTDKDEIFIGGVNLWQTSNGGTDWEISSMWFGGTSHPTVHADQHDLWYTEDGNRLLVGNDGGVYKSDDGGSNYDWIGSGKNTTQFYRIDASQQTLDKLIGGSQDNGTKLRINDWDHVLGGDGMECLIYESDDNLVLGASQNGNIFKSVNGGANFRRINSINGKDYDDIDEEGAWITPYAVSPSDTNKMIVGMTDMWLSNNGGVNFTEVDTEQNSKWRFIEYTPSNQNRIYAATNSQLWYSQNGGLNWEQKSRPGNQTITSLEIHPTDPNTLWATNGNWNQNNKVFKSTDGGDNWENITSGLPNLPANCVFYQENSNNRIYVGTDIGVYYMDDNSNGWVELNEGLPNTIVSDIEFNYQNERIYAGTYGRGVWYYDINPSLDIPTPIELPNQEIGVDLDNIELKWSKIPEATKYLLEVSTESDFSNLVSDDDNLTDTTKILGGLDNFTIYYWRVKAANGFAESDWSPVFEFRTKMATPILEVPNDKSTGVALELTLNWSEVSGADDYEIELSDDFTFDNIILTDQIEDSEYQIELANNLDNYTNYFWRVKAIRPDEETIWSDKYEFETIIGNVILDTPGDDNIDINLSGTLTWLALAGAEDYILEISDSDDFSNNIISEGDISGKFFGFSNLNYDKEYFWRVRGSYDVADGDWSQVRSFRTIMQPLVLNEFSNIYSKETELQLKWTSVGAQTNYSLQVALDNSFDSPMINILDISSDAISYNLSELELNTSYFARIRRDNSETSSAWSDFIEFVTKPATVNLDFPMDDFIDFSNENNFTWDEINGAEIYQIQISINEDFSGDNLYDSETSGTEFQASGLNSGKEYFWRVRAKSFNGNNIGDWSEIRSIITSVGTPNLNNPSNNSELEAGEVTLTWENFEDAISYTLEVSNDNNFSNIVLSDNLATNEKTLASLTPGDYFWRIKASVGAAVTDWSAVWKFTILTPKPDTPALLAPANETADKSPDSIEFSWQIDPNTDSYVIEIASDLSFNTLEYKVSDLQTNSIKLVSFTPNATYFWRVFSEINGELSLASEVWNFTTGESESIDWTLSFPPNNSKGIEYENLKLSWAELAENATYSLSIFKNNENSLLNTFDNIQNETSITIDLEANTEYYWYVESTNDSENIIKTNTWSFKTKQATSVLQNSSLNQFKIFPNPADDEINLQSLNNSIINSFDIYSITGDLMLRKDEFVESEIRIDVNRFPTGKYIIIFRSNDIEYNMNFTIKK